MNFRSARQRHRRSTLVTVFWQLVQLGLFLAVLVLVAVGAYQAGLSQNEESVRRMREDLEESRRSSTELVERAATAEEREKRLDQQVAQLERRYEEAVPKGQLSALLGQLRLELTRGTDPERLAFVIGQAGNESQCDEDVESHAVWVRTPASTVTDNMAGFADSRLIVSSEGRSARSENGLSEAWFDPAAPLIVRFLLNNGEVSSVKGELPLSHSVVLDGREYRFTAGISEEQGKIDVAAQSCVFP